MHSILVVPLGSPSLVEQAFAAGADAIVLDLAAGLRDGGDRASLRHEARDILRSAQLDTHRPHLYVGLEDLDDPGFDDDLAAVMVGEPDGIVLLRSRSGMDVQQLSAKLAVQEAEYGLAEGETGIIAEAGATARATFSLGSYVDAGSRLVGLTWNAAQLAADLGCQHFPADLADAAPLQMVRNLVLLAARSAGVAAIDTAAEAHDDAFAAACTAARWDGFNAKLTRSPEQVAIINAVFGRE